MSGRLGLFDVRCTDILDIHDGARRVLCFYRAIQVLLLRLLLLLKLRLQVACDLVVVWCIRPSSVCALADWTLAPFKLLRPFAFAR